MKRLDKKHSQLIVPYLIWALLYLQVTNMLPKSGSSLLADVKNSYKSQLDLAKESYYEGKFEEAIELINQCLQDSSLTWRHKIHAYTILTRSLLAKNDLENAKKSMVKILELDRTYWPTIEEETPQYVRLFSEVKKEQQQLEVKPVKSGIHKWIWIGAGGIAAVTFIAVISGGSGESDTQSSTLPEPPNFP